jgi:hypothetical protein
MRANLQLAPSPLYFVDYDAEPAPPAEAPLFGREGQDFGQDDQAFGED